MVLKHNLEKWLGRRLHLRATSLHASNSFQILRWERWHLHNASNYLHLGPGLWVGGQTLKVLKKHLFCPPGWEILIGWSGSVLARVRAEGVPKGGVEVEELAQGELVAFPCSNLPPKKCRLTAFSEELKNPGLVCFKVKNLYPVPVADVIIPAPVGQGNLQHFIKFNEKLGTRIEFSIEIVVHCNMILQMSIS